MLFKRKFKQFRRMYKILLRCTLLWSFLLGAFLGVLFYKIKHPYVKEKAQTANLYEIWFESNNLKRINVSADFLQYGNFDKSSLESSFLYNKVKLMCVVLVKKKRYEIAAKNTWTKRCNDVKFVDMRSEKRFGIHGRFSFKHQAKYVSSWRILCDGIRTISEEFPWVLVVYDDLFAIPENARKMVAYLNPDVGHYLGHAVSLWGVVHNAAPAGFLLSRGALKVIQSKFNSSDSCVSGGRFWRQEDYHLGRHLSSAGITPVDTRDEMGLTTFHSNLPERLLTSDETNSRINNGRPPIFPTQNCCSPFSVTFRVPEADRMYTYEYILYNLFVFGGGNRGNGHPEHLENDDMVWKNFVKEAGLTNLEVSADQYFELWKKVVNDPVHFNKNIRNWQATTASDLTMK